MTDEEKAEEYYENNECYSYLSEVEDFEEVFGFVKDRVKQAYLDGLAEGRKEVREHETTCINRLHYIEKENTELRAKISELKQTESEDAGTIANMASTIANSFEQIEKMKCCSNCKYCGACNRACNNWDKWEIYD